MTHFPDVIMNVGGPTTTKQRQIFNRLSGIVPFVSYKVGTKVSVYQRIIKGKIFSEYVIPYKSIKKISDVLTFIDLYKKVIVKPTLDSHGNLVNYIEKKDDGYIVRYKNSETHMSESQLVEYINQLLTNKKMLIQKYICSRRKTGEPFDFRIHMQKNGKGEWSITMIIPRVGTKGKIITNLSKGGQLSIFDRFLNIEFGKNYQKIRKDIKTFSVEFSKHFDTLYDYEFDELGIDIGLDENAKIWIYEVNWRPGHVFLESKAAKNAIIYAIYLAKKRKGGNK